MQETVNGDIPNELQGDIFKESRHHLSPSGALGMGFTQIGDGQPGIVLESVERGVAEKFPLQQIRQQPAL